MNRNGWYTKQHQQIKYIQCIGIWHRWMKWRRCEVQEWSEINTKRITFHKLLLQLQMCQQNVKKLFGIKSVRNLVHRSGTASVLISNGKSIFHIINFNFSFVNRWFFPYQNWTKLITCASPIPQAYIHQTRNFNWVFFLLLYGFWWFDSCNIFENYSYCYQSTWPGWGGPFNSDKNLFLISYSFSTLILLGLRFIFSLSFYIT